MLALGNIYDGSDVFDRCARPVQYRVRHAVDVSYGMVRPDYLVLMIEFPLRSHRIFEFLLHDFPVVWMNHLEEQFVGALCCLRVEAENPKMLVGPEKLSRGYIPDPATGMADSL